MTDHHDEMRVSPDPSQAEALRQRLHARMASVSPDVYGRTDPDPDGDPDGDGPITEMVHRRPERGRRPLIVALSAAAVVLALVAGAVALQQVDNRADAPITTDPPTTTVLTTLPGDPPVVWYDPSGLHHGDVVEQTPIEIGQPVTVDTLTGVLALVRSGAVYLDGPGGDVWFHPWGGEPRIVGHNSEAGPGGDPSGDIAVWFEGSDADELPAGPGELVVYDTAAGREISRTMESHGVGYSYRQRLSPGNGFLQVSAERVVWSSGVDVYSHDIRSRTTSVVEAPDNITSPDVLDVHDQIEVFWEEAGDSSNVVLRVPGRADERFPGLSPDARLSPSGNYLLAIEITETSPAVVMIDTRTGELWRLPETVLPVLAWSYGDIAMVDFDGTASLGARPDVGVTLLACDAARRACESLPAERGFLLPAN